MNQLELQPVLTWCHEHATEARDRLAQWTERFAADPCEAVRNSGMLMFQAVAEIDVCEGVIELLSKPGARITLNDLHAQNAESVFRVVHDFGRPILGRPGSETDQIYERQVAAVRAALQRVLTAARAGAK